MIKKILFLCVALYSGQASSFNIWQENSDRLSYSPFFISKDSLETEQYKKQKDYEEKVFGHLFVYVSQEEKETVHDIGQFILATFTSTESFDKDFQRLCRIMEQKLREHFGKKSSIVQQYNKNPAAFLLAFIVRDAFKHQFLNKKQTQELHTLLNEVCEKKGGALNEAQKKLKEFLEKVFSQPSTPQFIGDHKAFLTSLFSSKKIAEVIRNQRLDQLWENTERLLFFQLYEAQSMLGRSKRKYQSALQDNQDLCKTIDSLKQKLTKLTNQYEDKLAEKNNEHNSQVRALDMKIIELKRKIEEYEEDFRKIMEIKADPSIDDFLKQYTS